MDDSFGHWLAGFIDGEGCFCIAVTGGGAGRLCSLNVALRMDDRALLEEIQRQTGLGKVYDSPGRGSTKPYSRWIVQRQREARKVVELFDRYPLRGKKAADFVIWKQAVAVLLSGGPGQERYAVMDRLKIQLQAVREFDSDLWTPEEEEMPSSTQLRLVDER